MLTRMTISSVILAILVLPAAVPARAVEEADLYVKFSDHEYDRETGELTVSNRPLRFAEVTVRRPGDVDMTALTDAAGKIHVPQSGAGFTITLRAKATVGNQTVQVRKQAAPNAIHELVLTTNLDAPSSTLTIGAASLAPALNICDVFVDACGAFPKMSFTPATAATIDAYWESGSNGAAGTEWGRAVYYNDGGAHKIDVPGNAATVDDDGYDDDVLLEAFGRFLLKAYARDDAPGDCHYSAAAADKGYGVRLDLRQAWSEGWAHFFACLARDNPRSLFIRGGIPQVRFEIEGSLAAPHAGPHVYDPPAAKVSGPDNEFAVASLLWYIYSKEKAADPATAAAKIWDVVAGMAQPATLEEFYRVWAVRGHTVVAELDAAADARGIKYKDDGKPGDIATAKAAAAMVAGNTAACTFYTGIPAGWDDVDFFRIQLAQGAELEVKTTTLSNGADTILRVLDEAGFVLETEIPGNPTRTWTMLDGAKVSSIRFKAPYAGTNSYYIACSHSTEPLPAVDNAPSDSITSRCPARLGAYTFAVAAVSGAFGLTVDPADGAVDVAVSVGRVKIVFDGAVDPDTVSAATFTVKDAAGTAVAGSVERVGDSRRHYEYVFNADLATSAVYTVEVKGVNDLLGNALADFTSTFRTVGPFVTAVVPADDATDVAVTSTVKVTFAADVDAATVTTATFKLFAGATEVEGAVEVDPADARSFIFTPAEALAASTEFTVMVTGVADTNAVPVEMSTAYQSTFTTAGLEVSTWSPATGATAVPVTLPTAGIVITFNSPINPATACNAATGISSTITVTRDTDVVVGSWVQVTGPRTVVVRPAAYLKGSKGYTVTVKSGDEGVKGIGGATLAADAQCTFTTAAHPGVKLDEKIPRVSKGRAYSGSGFVDISWLNPFGDWDGLIIAGGTTEFPKLAIKADKDGKPALSIENGQEIYRGEASITSKRIPNLTNSGAPIRVNIWVFNGFDYSRAVSLESRAVAGATGMPGMIDEPEDDDGGVVAAPGRIAPQTISSGTGTAAAEAEQAQTVTQQPADDAALVEPVVLEEPVATALPRPLAARAGSGNGYVDIRWQVPDKVDGIIVAAGTDQFPELRIAHDANDNFAFKVLGGAVVYKGADSKKLRLATPNGAVRRFTLWTFAGRKVSRPISLETRAVAGAAGLQ